MIDQPDEYTKILEFESRAVTSRPAIASSTNEFDMTPFPIVPDYEVNRHIAAGMFGDVWLVRNELDRQFYAMKTLSDDIPVELQAIREFKKRVADNAYVVPIGHVGEADGLIYYIMPLADNALANRGLVTIEDYEPMTLSEFVVRNGKLPASRVIEVATCVLQGLQAIHSAGAVHRDVRADNIMQFDGAWRLADPGLMTALDVEPEANETHADLKSAAITLEGIYDLCDDPDASEHLLMDCFQRAKTDEIDPNRFQSAQQMLASLEFAKLKKKVSFRIPLLVASHLVIAYAALCAGWYFNPAETVQAPTNVTQAISPSEQLYCFSSMVFTGENTTYEDRMAIPDGERIYDAGFYGSGSSISTTVFVPSGGNYELSTRGFFGCERGIFQLKVNGAFVGKAFDMYAPKCQDHFATVRHDRMEMKEGWNEIKYELVSSNPSAKETNGAFVHLRLTPVEEDSLTESTASISIPRR